MSSALDDMYREVILDHYKSPRGKQPLDKSNVSSDGSNPACGDEISMSAQIGDDGVLQGVHVDCKGCAISTASASMLAESVKGRSFEEVLELAEKVKLMLKGEAEPVLPPEWEDIEALKGVRNFPVRVKCALLAWVTLVEGLKRFKAGCAEQCAKASTEEA
jgi:nitrogen fixation NifU-like protein